MEECLRSMVTGYGIDGHGVLTGENVRPSIQQAVSNVAKSASPLQVPNCQSAASRQKNKKKNKNKKNKNKKNKNKNNNKNKKKI
eukprot:gene2057-biopygen6140